MAEKHHIRAITDIEVGDRFGRLTTVRLTGLRMWLCQCACGKTKEVSRQCLRYGKTRSCGCLADEARRLNIIHGHSGTPTYKIWAGMISRCRLINRHQARMYTTKGIHVCDRWQSFENFLADMGERPPGLTIERKDGNGNYEPGNCVWATYKQQRANTSQLINSVTYRGQTRTLVDWAESLGLKYQTVYKRFKRNLPPEKVLAPLNSRL